MIAHVGHMWQVANSIRHELHDPGRVAAATGVLGDAQRQEMLACGQVRAEHYRARIM